MNKSHAKTLSSVHYFIGLVAILAGVYSQYFFHSFGFIPQLLVVYGIPIIVVSSIMGKSILKRAFRNNSEGFSYSIAYFGIFVVLSYLAVVAFIYLVSQTHPQALNSLEKPMPFLNISPRFAWTMVAVSMVVIGPAEEYLFRGYIFGGMLRVYKNWHWLTAAFLSSVLFAFAHLYYFFVFGLVSVIFFIDIIAIGMALAIAYYYSKGNLLAPSLVHGFFDATGFLSIATTSNIGVFLRLLLALLGLLIAFYLLIKFLAGKISLLFRSSRAS